MVCPKLHEPVENTFVPAQHTILTRTASKKGAIADNLSCQHNGILALIIQSVDNDDNSQSD